jgi:23S rRNA (adenine2030-N6)-methyltransferase
MVFFEKHPTEHKELVKAMGNDPRLQLKHADGYSGALKLSPRSNEKMICFVDPSYETSRDIDALALWTPKALKRWPTGTLILWLPLFKDGREIEFGEYLTELDDCFVAGARWPMDPLDEGALEGSAIVAYRAPAVAREASLNIASALQSWWAR